MENQDVYNGNTYVDTMNRDATECFYPYDTRALCRKVRAAAGSTIKVSLPMNPIGVR